jgi:hypothetical protein
LLHVLHLPHVNFSFQVGWILEGVNFEFELTPL